jgi:hypothetical protein
MNDQTPITPLLWLIDTPDGNRYEIGRDGAGRHYYRRQNGGEWVGPFATGDAAEAAVPDR